MKFSSYEGYHVCFPPNKFLALWQDFKLKCQMAFDYTCLICLLEIEMLKARNLSNKLCNLCLNKKFVNTHAFIGNIFIF